MKKKLGILALSTVLSINLVQTASAAEIWSEPTYTEQWSQPTYTDVWSEPTKTEIWSEPTETENWTVDEINQVLDHLNKNSTQLTFTILPVIQNGSVLVPLRGTLEQLGYTIEWHGNEQLVVIKKDNTIVKIKTNATIASINGKNVSLQSPAKMINGSVFVPLRFISQATGSKVDWDAATTKVTIDNQYYFYVNQAKQPQNQNSNQQPQTQSNIYAGVWEIWIPGGYATTDSTLNGDGSTTIKQEYVHGAKGKKLTIKTDGSYTWEVVGKTINGVWQAADKGRIVLTKGDMDFDWYVEKVDQNQIKIYSYGMEQHGTRIK